MFRQLNEENRYEAAFIDFGLCSFDYKSIKGYTAQYFFNETTRIQNYGNNYKFNSKEQRIKVEFFSLAVTKVYALIYLDIEKKKKND